MAITTVTAGAKSKFRSIEMTITKPASGAIGPDGSVLTHGKQVRVSEADAFTFVSSGQAKFIDEDDEAAAKAAK